MYRPTPALGALWSCEREDRRALPGRVLDGNRNVLSNGELLNTSDSNSSDKHRLLGSDRDLLDRATLRHPNRGYNKAARVCCNTTQLSFTVIWIFLPSSPVGQLQGAVRRNTLAPLRSLQFGPRDCQEPPQRLTSTPLTIAQPRRARLRVHHLDGLRRRLPWRTCRVVQQRFGISWRVPALLASDTAAALNDALPASRG